MHLVKTPLWLYEWVTLAYVHMISKLYNLGLPKQHLNNVQIMSK